jgi:hypothetical protein
MGSILKMDTAHLDADLLADIERIRANLAE